MTRFALILGLLLCLTVPAAGQKGDLQRQIAEKQRAIDALEKQIARGEQELTSIKKGKNSEQQSVQRLSRQIASRRQLLDETESQLSLLAEQLAASDSTAGALNVRLERYRAQYAAMVREAYRNYKQNSYLTYIFASKDFADVARRIANIRGVAKLREAKLREIAETAQEVGRQQELLAARRAVDTDRAVHLRLVNALFAVFLPDHVEVELHLRGGPVAPVDHERLPFQTIRRIEFSESEVIALDPVVLIRPFEPQRQRPRQIGPRRRGRNGVRRHFVAFSAVCHGDGPAENRIRLIGIEQIHARRGVGNEKADRRIHEIIDRHLVFHLLRTAGKRTQRQRNTQQKNFKITHKLAI